MARQPLFPDTDEKTERVLIELVRATPVWKKSRQIAEAAETCRANLKKQLKEWTIRRAERDLQRVGRCHHSQDSLDFLSVEDTSQVKDLQGAQLLTVPALAGFR